MVPGHIVVLFTVSGSTNENMLMVSMEWVKSWSRKIWSWAEESEELVFQAVILGISEGRLMNQL